jgi:hypothetical protein
MDAGKHATSSLGRAEALAFLCPPQDATEQPPLYRSGRVCLTAALGSLALGGAEHIVLDWAARCIHRFRVRLIVLRDASVEWPVPDGIEVTRLGGVEDSAQIERLGAEIAAGGNRVVLCHLLRAAERRALARGGVRPIPVLHNARMGWLEPAEAMAGSRMTIAVSRAVARDRALLDAPCGEGGQCYR